MMGLLKTTGILLQYYTRRESIKKSLTDYLNYLPPSSATAIGPLGAALFYF